MLTTRNAKAYAVLAIVASGLADEFNGLDVQGYVNGREHGFTVSRFKGVEHFRAASFSENRNSDQIVVYFANEFNDFNMQGNAPTDEVWKRAKYFGCDDYVKAANAVIEHLGYPE
jgi:hypothetical protein